MTCSPNTLALVERALSVRGKTPKQVNMLADTLSRAQIRHALRELVALGRAVADGPAGARQYRLPAESPIAETRRVHALAEAAEEA